MWPKGHVMSENNRRTSYKEGEHLPCFDIGYEIKSFVVVFKCIQTSCPIASILVCEHSIIFFDIPGVASPDIRADDVENALFAKVKRFIILVVDAILLFQELMWTADQKIRDVKTSTILGINSCQLDSEQ